MLTLSDTIRNAICEVVVSAWDGGTLEFYTGTRPARGAALLPGNTLLGTVTFNTPTESATAAGISTIDVTSMNCTNVATGTATWARIKTSAAAFAGDEDVTVTGGTGGITVNNVNFQQGGTTTVTGGSFVDGHT